MEYEIRKPDELYHYGVKGMKWGIRRNTKRLGSGDSEKSAKAVDALKKHRTKATNEIGKLNEQNVKLKKRHENNIIKTNVKAAQLNKEAANNRRKATRMFVSKRRAQKYLTRAYLAETKARDLIARANETKAKMEKNDMMIEMFNRGIKDIDHVLANRGRDYVNDKD